MPKTATPDLSHGALMSSTDMKDLSYKKKPKCKIHVRIPKKTRKAIKRGLK